MPPVLLMERLLAPPRPLAVDADLLRRWRSSPALGPLCPSWDPAQHGDPRRGRFRILGHERQFDVIPWAAPGVEPLWDERLAGLESTAALMALCQGPRVRRWLPGWLDGMRAATRPGDVALRPYPTATRLLHLLRTLALLADAAPDDAFAAAARLAWRDFAWLRWRVEHHNAANHLLRELVALAAGARVFGLTRLAERVEAQLARATEAQFPGSGGHVEQSPAYHLRALLDLLTIGSLWDADEHPWPGGVRMALSAARGVLEGIRIGDGLPMFGDGDGCPAPGVAAALTACDALQIAARPPAQGALSLLRLDRGGARLLMRCGPIPATTSAHLHCDPLALSWSVDGVRILGGRGTPAYHGRARDEGRSAAWHSTVEVPGSPQMTFSGPFRLGSFGTTEPRPAPDGLAALSTWPDGRTTHQRMATLLDPLRLHIVDTVDRAAGPITAWFHFPGATHTPTAGQTVTLEGPAGTIELSTDGAASATATTWYPRIGESEPASSVAVRLGSQQRAITTLRLVR